MSRYWVERKGKLWVIKNPNNHVVKAFRNIKQARKNLLVLIKVGYLD